MINFIDYLNDDELIEYIKEEIDMENEIKYNIIWDEHSIFNPNYNDVDWKQF